MTKFAFLIEPPFNFRGPDGAPTGCDVELAKAVFLLAGISAFEAVETEFSALLPGLAAKRWRMTTGLFATDERRKVASFTRPIWALPDGLLVRQGNPLRLSGYRSMARSVGCRLAVIQDQVQHRAALDFQVPDRRIAVFATYAEAAQAVATGAADAYASVGRAHTGFMQQNPDLALDVVPIAADERPPAFGAFAVAKDDDRFRTVVDAALSVFLGSAEHRSLMARFGFSDAEVNLVLDA